MFVLLSTEKNVRYHDEYAFEKNVFLKRLSRIADTFKRLGLPRCQ